MFHPLDVEEPMEVDEYTPSASCKPLQEDIAPMFSSPYFDMQLPLGEEVYLTVQRFGDKPTVAVRQIYYRNHDDMNDIAPGKQEYTMTTEQWQTLKRNMSKVSAKVMEGKFAVMNSFSPQKFPPIGFHLEGESSVAVAIFDGVPIVGLGQFFRPRHGNDQRGMLPGTKGINLTMGQWYTLENSVEMVDRMLNSKNLRKPGGVVYF